MGAACQVSEVWGEEGENQGKKGKIIGGEIYGSGQRNLRNERPADLHHHSAGAGRGPPPSSAPVDLDIGAFRVTKEVEHGGAVQVRLVVKNTGKFDRPRPATVVGMQNGAEGFRQILKISVRSAKMDTPSPRVRLTVLPRRVRTDSRGPRTRRG